MGFWTITKNECIHCGISIKDGPAIYITKTMIEEQRQWGKNPVTGNYEKGKGLGQSRIRFIGNTKIKVLMCMACFDKWYSTAAEEMEREKK
jgi:hypothetical protein